MKVALLDYGMGNLRSVHNALRALDADVLVVERGEDVAAAGAVVLPGVGAFGEGMRELRERGFVEALERHVRRDGRAFLGVCLGLQLLATRGFELGEHQGLGWFEGDIVRLPGSAALRVPHIGWNEVQGSGRLFANVPPRSAFYFVHSFVLPASPAASGLTDYGGNFVAALERDNVMAVQFHPEKSHRHGLTLLKNFLAFAARA